MIFTKKKYKVSLKGRSGIVYQEGDKNALIDAELLSGSTDLVIYSESLKFWQPPYETELISDDDKNKIKDNVTKELEAKGLIIEWE